MNITGSFYMLVTKDTGHVITHTGGAFEKHWLPTTSTYLLSGEYAEIKDNVGVTFDASKKWTGEKRELNVL